MTNMSSIQNELEMYITKINDKNFGLLGLYIRLFIRAKNQRFSQLDESDREKLFKILHPILRKIEQHRRTLKNIKSSNLPPYTKSFRNKIFKDLNRLIKEYMAYLNY